MIYCCIRTVNVVIAVELCPPAHVDIFQVGKMQLVKEADLIKHSTAVNGRSGTGAEDPAGLLVKEAAKFKSAITLDSGAKKADAKRIMAVMSMGVKQGVEVTVTVDGEDEDAAFEAIKTFFETNL